MDGIATQAAQIVVPAAGGTTFGLASRDFDGVNDYVQIPAFDFSSNTELSICAWVRAEDITAKRYNTFIRQNVIGPSRPDWLLAFQEYGTVLSFGASAGASYSELDVSISAANYNGSWRHIAAVYNGSTKEIFVDGSSVGSHADSGALTYTPGFSYYISYPASSEVFNGLVADVRIYSRAISGTEAGNLAAGTDISSTSLEGWWLLNDDDVLDYSGNGNNGTNNGSTYSTDGPLD